MPDSSPQSLSKEDLKRRVFEEIDARSDEIVNVAKAILQNPEPGFREVKTSKLVAEKFAQLGVPMRAGLAITGVRTDLIGGSAGPALAILLAMCVAVVWAARPRRLGAWAPALAFAIVVPIVGVMVWRGVELRAGHRHAMFQSKQLIEQVQEEHPSLAPDARVYLVDVPWLLILLTDRYVRDELRLYYGDIEVRAFGNEAQLDEADLERSDDDIIIYYRPPGRSP
ncbi:MAG: hypothetical protein IIC88_02450 [Chloroflexi bacterium]|nr:hypothetical protein [Chloroflexota bacterium]